jgi:ATP-binding cassette subfamily A (ABC1) protein 3
MDEADILGDRIAIMSAGQLRCVGSSLFLKKRYGVGYQLTIEKSNLRGNPATRALKNGKNSDPEADVDAPANGKNSDPEADVDAPAIAGLQANDGKLKGIVTNAVIDAALLNNVGAEMTYQLPMGAAPKFTAMFEGLDEEMEKGTISSYGVSITTLDEVFVLVARGEDSASTKEFESSIQGSRNMTDNAAKSARSRMDLENEGLFVRHVSALFRKRASFFKRDKKAWVCTTILPSLFVLIGFFIFKFVSPNRNLVPLTLSLAEFNPKVEAAPQNPIVFNNPDSIYTCQPARCAYEPAVFEDSETGEKYYFCGFQGRLAGNDNCTISESAEVVGRITDTGATPEPADVSTIFEVSTEPTRSDVVYA